MKFLKLWICEILNPETDSPSSVNVPVLSKTIMETLPATLIQGGSIQYIFFFFNHYIAYTIPADIARGRAGGIEIVIRSSQFSTIKVAISYSMDILIRLEYQSLQECQICWQISLHLSKI